jgi:aminopeptidase N
MFLFQKKTLILLFFSLVCFNFCFTDTNKVPNQQHFSIYGDKNIDVHFYHIKLDVDVRNPYIKGQVNCLFSLTSDVDTVRFDLHKNLKVDKVVSDDFIDFFQNENKLVVVYKKILLKGNKKHIAIFYEGNAQVSEHNGVKKGLVYEKHHNNQPVIATLSTPFLSHYWFPCNDVLNDKADSVYIDITVPDTLIYDKPLMAVSNGKLAYKVKRPQNKVQYRWQHAHPVAPCYIFFSISNYVIHKDIIKNSNGLTFPLEYYIFEENFEEASLHFDKIKQAVLFFSKTFGDYPFANERLGIAEIGFYNGIETQTCPIVHSISNDRFYTVIHEIAHAWFANNLTAANWQEAWLHEGFATYAEVLFDEYIYGKKGYNRNIQKRIYLHQGTLYTEATDNPYEVFAGIVYNKGAYILHTLRGIIGDDDFFLILQKYLQKYHGKNVVTADFKAVCEEVTHQNFDDFFNQWVYKEGYPIYNYTFHQNPKTNLIKLNIRQIQANKNQIFFKTPVQILLDFQYKDTIITINNNDYIQEIFIPANQKLNDLILDPNNWILKEIGAKKQVIEVSNNTIYDAIISGSQSGRTIELTLKSAKKQKVVFYLKDLFGIVQYKQEIQIGGTTYTEIEVPRNVPAGEYQIIVESPYEKYSQNWIIRF